MVSNFDIDISSRIYEGKDFFINYESKENLSLRGDESGFRYLYPEFNKQLDFYFKGPVNTFLQSMKFYSCIRIQDIIDEQSERLDSGLIDELYGDKLLSKISETKNHLLTFYDALIFNVNEWANIKSTQPLMILSDDYVMRDVHRRISSPENLETLFNKSWDLYETAIKIIPIDVALTNDPLRLTQLAFSLDEFNKNNLSVEKGIPRLIFNSNNDDVVEMLGLFKEGYHDKLLEHKLDKYF